MTQSQFSLSWSAHQTNICAGLSSLQQNNEFVDMTLAADGHHVKVHQVIMALASPYIKELISTAQCPHPVIFLNKISYMTLSAILEYIYTGEVLVPIENLSELIEAGKELHIKGLEDMNLNAALSNQMKTKLSRSQSNIYEKDELLTNNEGDCCYFEVASKDGEKYMIYGGSTNNVETSDIRVEEVEEETLDEQTFAESMTMDEDMQTDISPQGLVIQNVMSETHDNYSAKIQAAQKTVSATIKKGSNPNEFGVLQYTVSNQGSLQLILNRYVYYLKHTKRDGTRHWRCVDYLSQSRCPAIVVTNDDVVLQRISAHTHMFHDKKILKKVTTGAVFTAITEAIQEGQTKKTKDTTPSEPQHSE